MLSIAGQPAGLNGQKFVVDTHECCRLKNSKILLFKVFISFKYFFSIFIFFHGQRRALQLVRYKTRHLYIHVAYCRPNDWTDWAEIFCGHSGI